MEFMFISALVFVLLCIRRGIQSYKDREYKWSIVMFCAAEANLFSAINIGYKLLTNL